MNIFITTKLEKQLKKYQDIDRYNSLIQKLQQVSVNELYGLNGFGFKKFKGTNKVGAIDLGSDRIICMSLYDYPLRNDYCFNQYYSNQDIYNTLLLFFIAKHDQQQDKAFFVDKNSYIQRDFIDTNDKQVDAIVEDTQTTFKDLNKQEVLTIKQNSSLHGNDMQLKLPSILSGIAGSGKTVISIQAIKELQKKYNNTKKILYVTYSEGLKSFVEEKVNDGSVEIKTFRDLCIELKTKYENKKIELKNIMLNSKQFEKEFLDTRNTKYQRFIRENKSLIYSEICGILKGSMYVDWNRKFKKQNETFNNIVDRNSYINNDEKIPDDYKAFTKENRETLYNLTLEYNKWLQNRNMFDMNDIAFDLCNTIETKNIKYDYVIADEIQDLTEVQIYMLFLLSDKKGLIFTGDPNQVISPTFFKIGRLEKLFTDNEIKTFKTRLNENFRNSTDITKLINLVNEIRDEKLPARHHEDKLPEITRNNNAGIFGIIKYSCDNKKILFAGLENKDLDVAIIVSDEQKKENLEKEFPHLANIFTVSEIKGREYPNIITYNILSDYFDIFQNFYDKAWKKDRNYDFYFNQFYVAITRGEHNIYLLEEKDNIELINNILSKMNKYEIKYSVIQKINNINEIHLSLEEATDERYYLKALNFFNNEEFEKAKDHFEKVVKYNIDDTKKMIEVCDKFILEPNMNYNEKAKLLFSYNQFGLAKKYYEKDYNFELVAVMNLYQNNFENFEKVLFEKKLSIEHLYNKYDFAKQEIEKYFYHKEKELNDIYTAIEKSTTKIVKELTNE
jgi:hypothetical protein